MAPEIEGKVGRKIWCVDRDSFDLHAFLEFFAKAAPMGAWDHWEKFLQPNFEAMDRECKSSREHTVIPGSVIGFKIAGSDLFVPLVKK